MKSRTYRIGLLAATSVGLAVGSSMAFSSASAGHLNSVLEADLTGRAEVGPDSRMAGDPNGRGEAYVFGIDGDPITLDVAGGTLELEVSAEELGKRRANWTPALRPVRRGVLAKYAKLVRSANVGATCN